MRSNFRTKKQISKDELAKLLEQFPEHKFDGMRYTVQVKMAGGTWNKPIASKEGEKYYRIDD